MLSTSLWVLLALWTSIGRVSAHKKDDFVASVFNPESKDDEDITDFAQFELVEDPETEKRHMRIFAKLDGSLAGLCALQQEREEEEIEHEKDLTELDGKTLGDLIDKHRLAVQRYIESREALQKNLGEPVATLKESIPAQIKLMKKYVTDALAKVDEMLGEDEWKGFTDERRRCDKVKGAKIVDDGATAADSGEDEDDEGDDEEDDNESADLKDQLADVTEKIEDEAVAETADVEEDDGEAGGDEETEEGRHPLLDMAQEVVEGSGVEPEQDQPALQESDEEAEEEQDEGDDVGEGEAGDALDVPEDDGPLKAEADKVVERTGVKKDQADAQLRKEEEEEEAEEDGEEEEEDEAKGPSLLDELHAADDKLSGAALEQNGKLDQKGENVFLEIDASKKDA